MQTEDTIAHTYIDILIGQKVFRRIKGLRIKDISERQNEGRYIQ